METIGLPKEIEDLKGFEEEGNTMLGNDYSYMFPVRRKRYKNENNDKEKKQL